MTSLCHERALERGAGKQDSRRFTDGRGRKGVRLEGEKPTKFKSAVAKVSPTAAGTLGAISADAFRGTRLWTIRLVVEHQNGQTREARYLLDTGQ